ncbi:hypothetical protein Calow_1152 [Caldicellulosiruptor owensensis OL]|uniref:Uncharacterized protein n=1 Tax=Caldicellulosiruptor owensensis (strain ATCC 700167 / DSM 13100 / OL) TaxID=632518 RepID=E4Q1H7_CALOW|nr:hypothetical protein Calow_1152 [Caldicellulosiruptor owensensis OL]
MQLYKLNDLKNILKLLYKSILQMYNIGVTTNIK